MDNLETIVQEKLDADVDFNESIADLDEKAKADAINQKKSEIISEEFKSLSAKEKEANKKFLDQQVRNKKLDEEIKKVKQPEDSLSQSDIIAIAKADIDEDDMEDVIEFAKFKKISVKDALKNDSLKAIIADKEEKRKSAATANTRVARTGAQKPTDDAILSDALEKDKIPSKGSSEAEQLFWARRGGKR